VTPDLDALGLRHEFGHVRALLADRQDAVYRSDC
jgi:hypothetical protein